MAHDKDAKCRLICLQQIHLNRHTLSEIVYRARDVDWRVRKEVYTRLIGVDLKIFTIRQRVCLLHAGLTDRDERVKANCLKLVRGKWLEDLEYNIIEFLQLLHVDEYQENLEPVLMTVLELDLEKLKFPRTDGPPPYIDHDTVTAEMAFFWRVLVEYHHKCDNKNHYERFIADVKIEDFCRILEQHKKQGFIAQNLLKLSMHLDLADEYGRNMMIRHCRDLLKDMAMGPELIPDVMKVLRKLFAMEETTFVNSIREDVEEIRDPLMEEVKELSDEVKEKYEAKYKKLQGQIETIEHEIDQLSNERKFVEAERKTQQLQKKEEETDRVYKKLNKKLLMQESIYSRQFAIVTDLLQHTRIAPDHPLIETIEKDLIMPVWQSEVWTANADIRCQGVQALGTYCMLTKQYALLHMWLFFNLSSEDPEVQYVMVQVMLDLLLRYNFTDDELMNAYNPFADSVDENDQKVQGKLNLTNGKLIDHIFGIFRETEDIETKKVVVEGMCKLLMTNKLNHKKEEVLKEFILLFQIPYSAKEQAAPEMEIMDSIIQILAMFFPCYFRRPAHASEGSKQALLRVLVDCIMEITTKPSKHILRTIKRTQLTRYVLWLLEEKAGAADDSADAPKALHQRLAYLILQNLKQPNVNLEAKRSLCNVLVNLDISGKFPTQLIAVHDLASELKINDKTSKRELVKFQKSLTDALAALKKESDDDQPSVVEPDFCREEDVEFAEKIQTKYSQVPFEKAKRRSLPLMHSPGQTPTQMRGKKRKLTNVQKGKFSEDEEDSDSDELSENSEPAPKRKRKSKTPNKKKLSPKSRSKSETPSSKKRRSSLAESKKKSNKKSASSRKPSANRSNKKSSGKKSASARRSRKSSKRKRLSPVKNRVSKKRKKKLEFIDSSTDNTETTEKENACLNLDDDDFASLLGDGSGLSGRSSEVDDEIEALLNE